MKAQAYNTSLKVECSKGEWVSEVEPVILEEKEV